MGRGSQRTARKHGTRHTENLRPFGRPRGTMGRGTHRTETIWPHARHHGTRQHTGARHYGGRQYKSARHHRRAATYECAAALRERGSTGARHHICAATQLRGSIQERGTIANIDVNEAATNETICVAEIHKKIIYVCNGWHGRYNGHRSPNFKNILCWTRRFLKCALEKISYSSFT